MKLSASNRTTPFMKLLLRSIAKWEQQVPQAPLPNRVQDYVSFPSRLLSTPVLYLMSLVDQDPPVTAAAEREAKSLEGRWAAIKERMEAIKTHQLKAFAHELRLAGRQPQFAPWHSGDTPPPRVANVGA